MKNVLIISYYFPPMGMGGVQRTAKFAKYLPEFGWNPIVLTTSPKLYFAKDDDLLSELQTRSISIHRTKAIGSNYLSSDKNSFIYHRETIKKFLSYIGQSVLIPDTKRLWKVRALKISKEIINRNKVDLIFATAPPYTDFLIGYQLKKKFNIPLVLDYRDSWLDCPNNFYLTPLHKKFHRNLEEKIINSADQIITINNPIKNLILQRYNIHSKNKINIIPQGYDDDDFQFTSNSLPPKPKMRITYAGSFLHYYTPIYFLKALSSALYINPELNSNLEACFIGTLPSKYVKLINSQNLTGTVKLMGYLNHTDCLKYLMSSDVLWMMINRTYMSYIHSTGKLYEYFGARKPILACVPDGTAKESLKSYGAVKICEPDDIDSISKYILEFYELYKKNELPKPDIEYIKQFERRRLTKNLAEIFNNILLSPVGFSRPNTYLGNKK